LLKRWREGDKIFKDKFSSGITPKVEASRRRFEIPSNDTNLDSIMQEEDSQYGINPFISITPQAMRQTRKISMHHQSDTKPGDLCLSPKASVRSK